MTKHSNPLNIQLPRSWPRSVKVAMLHVISLAQFGMAYTRGWAVNSPIARIRLKGENERLRQHAVLLMEELRIKDARMMRIPAPERTHYLPTVLFATTFWTFLYELPSLLRVKSHIEARHEDSVPRARCRRAEPLQSSRPMPRMLVPRRGGVERCRRRSQTARVVARGRR